MTAPMRYHGKLSIGAQIAFISMLSAALTYATALMNYRTGVNALWMIALPVAMGVLLNRRKGLMSLVLLAASLLAVMAVGWALGGN